MSRARASFGQESVSALQENAARADVSKPICDLSEPALDKVGRPLLQLPTGWSGLPLGVFNIPGDEERGPGHAPHPTLLLALAGRGRRWYRSGARVTELSTAPQMLELYRQGHEYDSARWDGQAGLTVAVHLPVEVVASLTHEPGFAVATRHELFDDRLAWLVQTLHEEAQRGAPGGRLFAQGLSIALISWLETNYRPQCGLHTPAGGLSAAQQRRIRDFIEAGLGTDLSIERLAQEAALSPVHFSRLFKASFGCTPHRWVQQRRVQVAQQLLKTSDRPIADIALSLGFASQSHFTQVYRNFTGDTPGRARLC